MTPQQPDDAEVQRILALKRHEQPPPAFFQGFSDKVIDRIQTAGPAPKLTVRERLSIEFYGMPIYICAVGIVVFGLLVAGLIGSLRVEPPEPKAATGPANPAIAGEPSHAIVPPQGKPQLNSAPSPDELGGPPVRATLAVPETAPGP